MAYDTYSIQISILKQKKESFSSEKKNFSNSSYATFSSSYVKTCSDGYVNRMARNLDKLYQKIEKGYSSIDKWWASYLENIEGLESCLAHEKSPGILTEASLRSFVMAHFKELDDYDMNFSGVIKRTSTTSNVLFSNQTISFTPTDIKFGNLGNTIKSFVQKNQNSMLMTSSAVQLGSSLLNNWYRSNENEIKGLIQDVNASLISNRENAKSMLEDAMSDARKSLAYVGGVVSNKTACLWNDFCNWCSEADAWCSNATNEVKKVVNKTGSTVKSAGVSLLEGALSVGELLMDKAIGSISNSFTSISKENSTIKSLQDKVNTFVTKEHVKSIFDDYWSSEEGEKLLNNSNYAEKIRDVTLDTIDGVEALTNIFGDAIEVYNDISKKVNATVTTATVSLTEGVAWLGESLIDGVATLGTKFIVEPWTNKIDFAMNIISKHTDTKWESLTDKVWDKVQGFVTTEYVESAYNKFWTENEIGKSITEEAYFFEQTRDITKGIGYVGGITALTIATGGGALAAGGLAFVGGTGKNTSEAWNDGASTQEGVAYGTLMGLWEGLQMYTGFKVNGLDIASKLKIGGSNGFKQLVNSLSHVVIDAIDGASAGVIQPAMNMIYNPNETNMEEIMYLVNYDDQGNQISNKTWEDLSFVERYQALFEYNGGVQSILTGALLGASMSLISEVPDIFEGYTGKSIMESLGLNKQRKKIPTEVDTPNKIDNVETKNNKVPETITTPKKDLATQIAEANSYTEKGNLLKYTVEVDNIKDITPESLKTIIDPSTIEFKVGDKTYSYLDVKQEIGLAPKVNPDIKKTMTIEKQIAEVNNITRKGRFCSLDVDNISDLTFEKLSLLNDPDNVMIRTSDGSSYNYYEVIEMLGNQKMDDMLETIPKNSEFNGVETINEFGEVASNKINSYIKDGFKSKFNLKKSLLGASVSAINLPSRFIYKSFTDNANFSKKVLDEGLYHFTNLETANKILESGYLKKSGRVTSYGCEKSFFFAGIPKLEDIAVNIDNFEPKRTAVRFKVSESKLGDFSYRPFADEAVTYKGDYHFNKGDAEIVYLGLFEENGTLVYKELSKADYDNYVPDISPNKLNTTLNNCKNFMIGMGREYDYFTNNVKKIEELVNVRLEDTKAKVATGVTSLVEKLNPNKDINGVNKNIEITTDRLEITTEKIYVNELSSKTNNILQFKQKLSEQVINTKTNIVDKFDSLVEKINSKKKEPFSQVLNKENFDEINESTSIYFTAKRKYKSISEEYQKYINNNVPVPQGLLDELNAAKLEMENAMINRAKSRSKVFELDAKQFNDPKLYLYSKLTSILERNNSSYGNVINWLYSFANDNTADISYQRLKKDMFDYLKPSEQRKLLEIESKSREFIYSQDEKDLIKVFTKFSGPQLAAFCRKTTTNFRGRLINGTNKEAIDAYLKKTINHIFPQKSHLKNAYSSVEKWITAFDNIIKKSPPLEESITVYREVDSIFLDNNEVTAFSIGQRFNDPAFVSTAINPPTSFTERKIHLEIELPKGTKGAYLEPFAGIANYKQQEFLLARNTTFEIVNTPILKEDGSIIIKAKVVPDNIINDLHLDNIAVKNTATSYYDSFISAGSELDTKQQDLKDVMEHLKNKGLLERFESEIIDIKNSNLYQFDIPEHNIDHVERVLLYSMYMGDKLKLNKQEMNILIEASRLHDSGRVDLRTDTDHGGVGAKIASDYLKTKYDNKTINKIATIIELHEAGEDSSILDTVCKKYNVSPSEYSSVSKIASILKDADALDRIRFPGNLKLERLRNDVSKTLIKPSYQLQEIRGYVSIQNKINMSKFTQKQLNEIKYLKQKGVPNYLMDFYYKYPNYSGLKKVITNILNGG